MGTCKTRRHEVVSDLLGKLGMLCQPQPKARWMLHPSYKPMEPFCVDAACEKIEQAGVSEHTSERVTQPHQSRQENVLDASKTDKEAGKPRDADHKQQDGDVVTSCLDGLESMTP